MFILGCDLCTTSRGRPSQANTWVSSHQGKSGDGELDSDGTKFSDALRICDALYIVKNQSEVQVQFLLVQSATQSRTLHVHCSVQLSLL